MSLRAPKISFKSPIFLIFADFVKFVQQKTALAEMRVLFITSNQNCRSREEKLSLRAPKIPFKSTSFLILADVVKFVQKMSVVDRKRVFLKIHSFEPIASSNLKFVSLRENS